MGIHEITHRFLGGRGRDVATGFELDAASLCLCTSAA